jgi:hypothetical protein
MTIYNTKNGVKPRYDGGGSEFGLMHRDLGPGYLMFDVDRMSACLSVDLELKRANTGFIEYRRNNGINFVAVFEIKYAKIGRALEALDMEKSNTMAQIEMARRLDARLFSVFATDGVQPFEFWEYVEFPGEFQLIGTLDYDATDRTERVRDFWRDVLGIER